MPTDRLRVLLETSDADVLRSELYSAWSALIGRLRPELRDTLTSFQPDPVNTKVFDWLVHVVNRVVDYAVPIADQNPAWPMPRVSCPLCDGTADARWPHLRNGFTIPFGIREHLLGDSTDPCPVLLAAAGLACRVETEAHKAHASSWAVQRRQAELQREQHDAEIRDRMWQRAAQRLAAKRGKKVPVASTQSTSVAKQPAVTPALSPGSDSGSPTLIHAKEVRRPAVGKWFDGWQWPDIYAAWSETFHAAGGTQPPVPFHDVALYDLENFDGRPSAIAWWPKRKKERMQAKAQEALNRNPGCRGIVEYDEEWNQPTSPAETLAFLHGHRESAEKQAAILINASLFFWLHSTRSRRYVPLFGFPPGDQLRDLDRVVSQRWSENDGPHWHWSSTHVLPPAKWRDDLPRFECAEDFLQYLAVDHATITSKWLAIELTYPLSKAERRSSRPPQSPVAPSPTHAEAAQPMLFSRAEPKEETPFQKWMSITASELEALVWSRPVIAVAAEFAISDVAVLKRCKSMGISTPGRGFWAKVAAGKLPHPNGKQPR